MYKKPYNFIRQKLAQNSFVSDSLKLSISNLVASGLNYFYLLIAAFYLKETEFGVLGTAVGVLTLLTMIGNIIQLQSTAKVAFSESFLAAKQYTLANLKKLVSTGAITFLVVCLFAKALSTFLNTNIFSILVLSITSFTLFGSCVANGFTAGLRQLHWQASLLMFSAVGKFISGLILLFFGLNSPGAIIAYAIGYSIIIYFSLNHEYSGLKAKPNTHTGNQLADFSPKNNSVALVFVYALLLMPFVLDQLLVQHYSPMLSGAYAALGILGKLVFFLSAPILSVVYSHACGSSDLAQQVKIFQRGALTLVSIIFFTLTGWGLFGGIFGRLMIPSQYHGILPQVLLFCVGVSTYSLSYLLVLFAIVRAKYWVGLALLPAVLLQLVMFSLQHASITEAVGIQLMVYVLQFICLSVFTLLFMLRRKFAT